MYRYDEFDSVMVTQRVSQFRQQVSRRLNGELTEDQFKPLRLMNGLYLQLHAYMLRVAIPYGTLSARQLRQLAIIANKYDKDYGHFTTRQNIQYNWVRLAQVPDLLDDLAKVEMHAIQTSGNCIRNITVDHFAGISYDEIADPRPFAEMLRQWSTFHPEFTYLPRKFKIAVIASRHDRAAMRLHDLGVEIVKNSAGEIGAAFWAGGGMGRTPIIAKCVSRFIAQKDMLAYATACLRVYNELGRRDNIYKARIKILLHEMGVDNFIAAVDAEFAQIKDKITIPVFEIERITTYFQPPKYESLPEISTAYLERQNSDVQFNNFTKTNIHPHKIAGYCAITISLKPVGLPPGDATTAQMLAAAEIAEKFSFDEIRVTHEQNLFLPYIRLDDAPQVFDALQSAGLASANAGLISDIICCPGLDYCDLANARSIPISAAIGRRFSDLDRQYNIGPLKIKISGCINACGHHHVGHIGILGVDKKGSELYQLMLGGSADENTSLATITGAGFSAKGIIDAVEIVIKIYLSQRLEGEEFLTCYRRIGMSPFKQALYASN